VQGLDGEHAVDAAPEPARDELVDPAVTVEDVDADAVRLEGVRDPLVAGHHELLEEPGRHERAVVVAHVLPPPGDVDPARRDVLPDELEIHQRNVFHHFLDPGAVGHEGDGQVLEAHPVAQPAVERAAVEEDGHAGGVGRGDGRRDVSDPAGTPGIEALVAQQLPIGPGLDGELEELGHGRIVIEHLGQGPVLGLHDAPLAPAFESLFLELRKKPLPDGDFGDDGYALQSQAALDVLVRPAVAGQALLVPNGDRLVPVAELHVRDAVRLFPAEDPVESLSCGHGQTDHIAGIRRPSIRIRARVEMRRRL